MKRSSWTLTIGIIGFIIIIVTLSIFFLADFEKSSITWWALYSLLLAEIVFFGGLGVISAIDSPANNTFFRAGVTSALLIYLIATVVICLLAGAFNDNVNAFVIIQIILIAIAAIIVVLISFFSRRLNSADQKPVINQQAKRGGF